MQERRAFRGAADHPGKPRHDERHPEDAGQNGELREAERDPDGRAAQAEDALVEHRAAHQDDAAAVEEAREVLQLSGAVRKGEDVAPGHDAQHEEGREVEQQVDPGVEEDGDHRERARGQADVERERQQRNARDEQDADQPAQLIVFDGRVRHQGALSRRRSYPRRRGSSPGVANLSSSDTSPGRLTKRCQSD